MRLQKGDVMQKMFPHPLRRLLLVGATALLVSCQVAPSAKQLTVLYTNDEHGWMEGMGEANGAANLMQLWRREEGYDTQTANDFLLLSGGDNWTGPAISTWNQGESMVELMNTMGYTASAVGNHEFDFGLEAIRARSAEADYAYLSANTTWAESGRVPEDLGIYDYRIAQAAGLRIGIIGLTTRETATTTNPVTVASLRFADYESTLRNLVPRIEAQGVDLLFVISHVCLDELEPLINEVADLGIDLVGAGHCNELVAKRIGDTVLLGGGFHFGSYASARFELSANGEIKTRFATRANSGASEDATTAAIVSRWREQSAAALSEVLGFVAAEVPRGPRLDQLVVDSWLRADPSAQVAITNAGGIRAPLLAGQVTLGDTVAILPFDNTLVVVEISGADLLAVLAEGSRPRVAGLMQRGGEWTEIDSGERVAPGKQYRVLVNSFMYAGGDGYERLALADPEGYDTGIQYGEPFREWLRSLASSEQTPAAL